MEWISIKERIPKEHEWVILGSKDKQLSCTGMLIDGKFYNPDLSYFMILGVSHWMPFPEPPINVIIEWGGCLKVQTADGTIVNAADDLNRRNNQ